MKVHMNDWASELWIRGVITQWVISTSMTEHAESQEHDPLWHDGTCPDEDNCRFARKRAKSDGADAHSVCCIFRYFKWTTAGFLEVYL